VVVPTPTFPLGSTNQSSPSGYSIPSVGTLEAYSVDPGAPWSVSASATTGFDVICWFAPAPVQLTPGFPLAAMRPPPTEVDPPTGVRRDPLAGGADTRAGSSAGGCRRASSGTVAIRAGAGSSGAIVTGRSRVGDSKALRPRLWKSRSPATVVSCRSGSPSPS